MLHLGIKDAEDYFLSDNTELAEGTALTLGFYNILLKPCDKVDAFFRVPVILFVIQIATVKDVGNPE